MGGAFVGVNPLHALYLLFTVWVAGLLLLNGFAPEYGLGMVVIAKSTGGDSYALRSIPEIGGAFLSMASHGADQLIVQRLLRRQPSLPDELRHVEGR